MGRSAIFLSYRRDDTADVAGRLYDSLIQHFGRSRVFKDVDSLQTGADFAQEIRAFLPKCRVVLVMIGPKWLQARVEGGLRLLNPTDLVRVEIETALALPELTVVPVLVNGATLPRPEDLPESLRPLLHRHSATIRRDPD